MNTFREYLSENKTNKLWVEGNVLWFGYGDGSGVTTTFDKSYISNDKSSNFDDLANKIGSWATKNKPIKESGHQKLFELPHYDVGKNPYNTDKPNKISYFIVSKQKHIIVGFFETKK